MVQIGICQPLAALLLFGCSDSSRTNTKQAPAQSPSGSWILSVDAYGPIRGHAERLAVTTAPFQTAEAVGARRARLKNSAALGVSAANGEVLWETGGVPPVAYADAAGVVLYGRGGLVVRLDWSGKERWRVAVEDDRSQPARKRGDATSPFAASAFLAGDHIIVPAGGALVSIADDGALHKVPICDGNGAVVLAAGSDGDGGAVALCGQRSEYDDETKAWDGPTGHGERPTYSEERSGPETIVRVNREGATTWRHRVEFGLSGWTFGVRGSLLVYVTPSGDATPARAVGVRIEDGTQAWTTALPLGPADVETTGLGFLIGSALLDDQGVFTWSTELPLRAPERTTTSDILIGAGDLALVLVDLRTGVVARQVPIAPLEGGVRVALVAGRRAIFVVDGRHPTLVGMPL